MDVLDLKRFYAGETGRMARRLIAARLRDLPQPPRDARVLGLGYATPWLERYDGSCAEVFSAMPARLGVVHWPHGKASRTLLTEEDALPFPDASLDLVLVAHGLELSHVMPGMLREIWRVLAAQGHVVFIVPNRRGLWARFDSTPFGHGRPFSRRQLEAALKASGFAPLNVLPALFAPPSARRYMRRAAFAWERAGKAFWPGFSGVLIMEAVKQVYAVRGQRRRELLFPGLKPLPSPALGQVRE